MNGFANKEIVLSTDGPGIVLYSPENVICAEGEDYFTKEFNTPEKVASHLKKEILSVLIQVVQAIID